MKSFLKKMFHALFGEYSIYRIYTSKEVNATFAVPSKNSPFTVRQIYETDLADCVDSLIRDQVGYLGADSFGFACFDGERAVGVCFYWFGQRYLARNFWPLAANQAKLVHIVTLPEMRGRAVASTLVALSDRAMRDKGFDRNFARIWHSNEPSLRAFERAGWSYVATIVEINPFRLRKPFRLRWK